MTNNYSSQFGKQPFKYSGKELDRMHGLNWYDHGARMSDPALGRWHVVDSLCEKYYDMSPYALCGNDPVNNVDKDGRIPLLANVAGALIEGGVEIASQVAVNYLTNKEITDIKWEKVTLASVEGFATCGGGAVRKVAIKVGSAIIDSAIENYNDNKTFEKEKIAKGTLSNLVNNSKGTAVGKVGGSIAKRIISKKAIYNKTVSSVNKMTKRVSATGLNNKTSRKIARNIVNGQKMVTRGIPEASEATTAKITDINIRINEEKNKK